MKERTGLLELEEGGVLLARPWPRSSFRFLQELLFGLFQLNLQ
jgi:hypothetical protein